MSGIFERRQFNEIGMENPFFDGLKNDYPEFEDWFTRKSSQGAEAIVSTEDGTLKTFLYLKEEEEPIELSSGEMSRERRLKIGTLKVSDDSQGYRLGEGALGIALWNWQRNQSINQIYVTAFDRHDRLIGLIELYGFELAGYNKRGEGVYVKDKRTLSYETPKTSFPYINPDVGRFGYIPIDDIYHDTLFPYSGLSRTIQSAEDIAAANGMVKIFIATPYDDLFLEKGDVALIYRRHTGNNKQYKSVVTSFCTIVDRFDVKTNYQELMSYQEFRRRVGNKSVYSESGLSMSFRNKNLVVLELIYNGFLGSGNNITYRKLKDEGLFEGHPYQNQLSRNDFEKIIGFGGIDVEDITVNQA